MPNDIFPQSMMSTSRPALLRTHQPQLEQSSAHTDPRSYPPNRPTAAVSYGNLPDRTVCVCVGVRSPHLFQRSSSSPPQPQNALGNPLTCLNCFTVRPLTPPKNSLYGSLGETIIRIKFILSKGYICCICP